MKTLQNFFLFFFIFLLILIAGCKVEVQQPVSTIPPTPPEQQQTPTQEAQPPQATTQQTQTPQEATPQAQVPGVPISSLQCDGKTYNVLVKPKYNVMSILVPSEGIQKIMELKAEGIVEELIEFMKNDGASVTTLKSSHKAVSGASQSSGSRSEGLSPGWIYFLADVKIENYEAVNKKVREVKDIKVSSEYTGFSVSSMLSNNDDKEAIFEFKCRIATGPGRITVYNNIPESSFTITGPKSYAGNGLCWTTFEALAGKYTFTFNDVAGYTAPSKVGSELRPEEHLKLGANYRASTPADTGVIVVIANLPEAKFKITGPAAYSGSGTCWGQANVPTGQYQVEFEDVSGYELSYFDKEKSIYVSSGFGMQTAEAEYKKIGEES